MGFWLLLGFCRTGIEGIPQGTCNCGDAIVIVIAVAASQPDASSILCSRYPVVVCNSPFLGHTLDFAPAH